MLFLKGMGCVSLLYIGKQVFLDDHIKNKIKMMYLIATFTVLLFLIYT